MELKITSQPSLNNLTAASVKLMLPVVALLLSFCMLAEAQDQTTAAVTTIRSALTPILVALGIAYVTRRRAIGGWLFYFYLSVFGSIAISWVFVIPALKTLFLDTEIRDFYWWISAVDYLLPLAASFALWILAIRLLFKKQRVTRNLTAMKYATAIAVAANLVSAYISTKYFAGDPSSGLTYLSLVSSIIWCAYWLLSKRVQYVMTRGNVPWDYEEFKQHLKGR